VKPGAALSMNEKWYLIDNVKRPEIDEGSMDSVLKPIAEKTGIKVPVIEFDGWKNAPVE